MICFHEEELWLAQVVFHTTAGHMWLIILLKNTQLSAICLSHVQGDSFYRNPARKLLKEQ